MQLVGLSLSCGITLSGYSNGSTYASALSDKTNGGECLQNLKLAVRISSMFNVVSDTIICSYELTFRLFKSQT